MKKYVDNERDKVKQLILLTIMGYRHSVFLKVVPSNSIMKHSQGRWEVGGGTRDDKTTVQVKTAYTRA